MVKNKNPVYAWGIAGAESFTGGFYSVEDAFTDAEKHNPPGTPIEVNRYRRAYASDYIDLSWLVDVMSENAQEPDRAGDVADHWPPQEKVRGYEEKFSTCIDNFFNEIGAQPEFFECDHEWPPVSRVIGQTDLFPAEEKEIYSL